MTTTHLISDHSKKPKAPEAAAASLLIARRSRLISFLGISALFLAGWILAGAAAASTTEIIYSFAGEEDGEYLDTDVEIDAAGNLYGTSVLGGDFGGGTVWQLSPVGQRLGAYGPL